MTKLVSNSIVQKVITLAIAYSLTWPIPALAVCERPHPPVCAEFFHRDAVFVGTVISSRHRSEGEDPGWFYALRVTSVFRGVVPPVVKVFTEDSSARFPLKVNQSYLLFASSSHFDRLEIDNCGNSVELAKAGGAIRQLEQIQSLAKSGADGYVAGGVMRWDGSPNTPIAGVSISAQRGGKNYKTVTGANGWFHIDLPAGKYALSAESSEWSIVPYDLTYDDPSEVVIQPSGCAVVQFGAVPK